MDPCELFISEAKRFYDKKLAELHSADLPSLRDRVEFIIGAYESELEESIINEFMHVGLDFTPKKPNQRRTLPETIMKNLLFEGTRPKKKFKALHDEQERAYLIWKTSPYNPKNSY